MDKHITVDKEKEDSIISHGKHKSKTFRYVFESDLDYCEWVLDQTDHTYLLEFREWLNDKLLLLKVLSVRSKVILEEINILLRRSPST
jgi:hypothetical protein